MYGKLCNHSLRITTTTRRFTETEAFGLSISSCCDCQDEILEEEKKKTNKDDDDD
jgi:hypothetical protein